MDKHQFNERIEFMYEIAENINIAKDRIKKCYDMYANVEETYIKINILTEIMQFQLKIIQLHNINKEHGLMCKNKRAKCK